MRHLKKVSVILSAAMVFTSCLGFAQPQTEVPQTEITSVAEKENTSPEPSVVPEEGVSEENAVPPESAPDMEPSSEPDETAVPEESPIPGVSPTPSRMPEETGAEEQNGEDELELADETEKTDLLGDSSGIKTVSVENYDISDSLTRYEDFDYSDPQYITDEVLFGEWDESAQAWVPQDNPMSFRYNVPGAPEQLDKPLLDYSKSEDLQKVEEAVKTCEGNYNKPKALLLQYYQNKFNSINKTVTVAGDKATTVRSNALAYNFVTENLTSIDMFDMSAEKTIYEFDVTSQISSLLSGTVTKSFVFVINALEVDQHQATFASKESGENMPYVTLELTDGSTRTFYPDADATIKGGSNAANNFGSDTELYASEKHDRTAASDNYSQKAVIRFDFSDIAEGTRVKSATFGVCGWTDKTDAPKKMYLASTSTVSWQENAVTWNSMNFARTASCDTYGGLEPSIYGNNGFYTFVSNVSVLASRYLYDNNEDYAYHAIRLFLWYHQVLQKGPFVYNDFLDKGVNGFNLMDSFYSLINSEHMTPAVFAALLKSAFIQTEWIQEGWNHSGNLNSNHATYYNKGFADLISLLTEFDKSDDPIIDEDPTYTGLYFGGRGGWIPCLQRRVMYKAKEISFPDGAGKEVAGGYNMEAYANTEAVMQYFIETDMLDLLPDEYYDMMATAALYFMHGMAPGYHDWNIGNSYGYGSQFINRTAIKDMIDALKMLLDEDPDKTGEKYLERQEKYNQLLYAYTGGKQGTEPAFESILYPFARKVVLRSSWDANAVGATMGISNGGVHCHFDDLNVVVAAYGRYLLADPGTESYTQDNPYRAWNISTRAHNTIEINDISQRSGLWSNSEMVIGPAGEKIVLPFRNDHGLILANNVIADAIEEPENAELKAIVDAKDYTSDNLEKLYELDDQLAIEANPSVNTRHFQGRFLENEMNDIFDYTKGETYNNIDVTYTDDQGYFGTRGQTYTAADNAHNRSLLFIKPGFFIVTDYVEPINGNTQVNKYNQTWHFTNDAAITMDPVTKAVRTNFDDANIAVVPVMSNETEMTASIEDGWYHTGTTVPAEYVSYVKNESQATTFNTMLVTMAPGENYETVTETIDLDVSEAKASAFSFNMVETNTDAITSGTYYNVHDASAQAERQVGGYTTDGRMMYVDKGAKRYKTAILMDGTSIADEDGNYLIYSDETISHLGVAWDDTRIELGTSRSDDEASNVDLSKVTVYTEKTVESVTMDAQAVPFKQSGNYIYFGDSPIIDDPDDPTPSATPNPGKPSSSHGSGGGGGSSSGGGTVAVPEVSPDPGTEPDETENPAENANFQTELEGHWAEKEITALLEQGIVKGISETSLGLEEPVTRAEFVTMLARAFELEEAAYGNEFGDVSAGDWYAGTLAAAKKAGILDGDENGNANPNSVITREEMAKIAVSALEKLKGIATVTQGDEITFTDRQEISGWAKSYVESAAGMGLIVGMEDGSFRPKDNVLREQAMVITYRCANLE